MPPRKRRKSAWFCGLAGVGDPIAVTDGDAERKRASQKYLRNYERFESLFRKGSGEGLKGILKKSSAVVRCRTPQYSWTTKRLGNLRIAEAQIFYCCDFDGGSNSSAPETTLSVCESCIVSSEGL